MDTVMENDEVMNNDEVMIDIETLSTSNNACILTIGAIKFNRHDKTATTLESLKKDNKTFYARITRKSCLNLGMEIDLKTMEWWNTKVSEEARHEAIYNQENRIDVKLALKELSKFLTGTNYFWSQGSFDYNILENAYNACNLELPWKFWQVRDSRTLFDVFNINLKTLEVNDSGHSHNSLNDAYKQVTGLKICFE